MSPIEKMIIEENHKITMKKKQNEELNKIFVKYCNDNDVFMLGKNIISEYILAESIFELFVNHNMCAPCPPPPQSSVRGGGPKTLPPLMFDFEHMTR